MDTVELMTRQRTFSIERDRGRLNKWQGRTAVATILILGNSGSRGVDELKDERPPGDDSVAYCVDFC